MEKERYEKIIEEKDKLIEHLQTKINQLERRFLAYENAHTPSSKQRFKKKD